MQNSRHNWLLHLLVSLDLESLDIDPASPGRKHGHHTESLLGRPGGHCEGQYTRSHPELGRENPQRRWYSVLRRGRVGHRQVFQEEITHASDQTQCQLRQCSRYIAGWSSPVARQAHNLKVRGSNPLPATNSHNTRPRSLRAHARTAR